MVMHVHKVEGEYRVILSPDAMAALHLTEGSAVDVRQVADTLDGNAHRTATIEEGLAAFDRVEPLYRDSLMELASK